MADNHRKYNKEGRPAWLYKGHFNSGAAQYWPHLISLHANPQMHSFPMIQEVVERSEIALRHKCSGPKYDDVSTFDINTPMTLMGDEDDINGRLPIEWVADGGHALIAAYLLNEGSALPKDPISRQRVLDLVQSAELPRKMMSSILKPSRRKYDLTPHLMPKVEVEEERCKACSIQ